MAHTTHVPAWAVPTRRQIEYVVGVVSAAGPSVRADEILEGVRRAGECSSAAEAIGASKDEPVDVAHTLLWLAGMVRMAPVDVPRFRDDGQIVSVDELVAEAVEREPYRYRLPEDRAELRSKLAAQVAKWRRLDALTAGPRPSALR